ncbi:MAG: hypothetical protein CVV02_13770 [Firmicutes bacterium HGW-Firmicutes-7]|nr:MAG: hypothetical protein CVV02_13770 [Firmicutes bacterium HGW-Firmicutes-7]
MSNKEKISTNQFVWMLFGIITSFTVLQIPGILILHAGRDAWLSVIVAWFLDVLLALVYAYMGLRFPGQNFVQYSMTILGKLGGRIVGFIFPLYFLMVTALLMRAISTLIETNLSDMPKLVIYSMGCITIAYTARKGIEIIARVCEILGPIYLISLFILFFMAIPIIKIDRVKPFLMEGSYPFLSGSILILSFIGICIMMAMYIPVCNHPENGFKAKFIAVTMGATMITTLIFLVIGAFGAEQAGSMVNPGASLAREIQVGIFERLESVWLIVAVGAGIMTCVNLIWAFSMGASQIIGLNSYKPLVLPATLIATVLSIISFDSNIEMLNFVFYVYTIIAVFVQTGLEMFLFAMAFILKKGAKKSS